MKYRNDDSNSKKQQFRNILGFILALCLGLSQPAAFAVEALAPGLVPPQNEISTDQTVALQQTEIPSGGIEFDGPLSEVTPTVLPHSTQVEAAGYSAADRPDLPGFVTIKQMETDHFSYRYDLGAASGATVDVSILNRTGGMNFSDGFVIEIQRVNDIAESPGLDQASILFVDTEGQRIESRIDLSSEFQAYSFELLDGGFLQNSVQQVMIRHTYEDLTPRRRAEDRRGEIFVQLGSLEFPAQVSGQAFDPESLSRFPPDKTVAASGFTRGHSLIPGFITLLEESETDEGIRAFRYDVGGSKSAVVVSEISAEPAPFVLDENFVVAVKNSGNQAKAMVHVTDEDGFVKEFILALTEEFQNFVLDLSRGPADPFDFEKVTKVEIELTRKLSPERRGRIDFYVPMETGAEEDPFLQEKPQVTSAASDTAGNAVIEFSALDEAVIYQVQVARDADFTDILHEGFPASPPERFVLNESGGFFVRVRGSKNIQVETGPVSQWSDAFQFEVRTGLTLEELLARHAAELAALEESQAAARDSFTAALQNRFNELNALEADINTFLDVFFFDEELPVIETLRQNGSDAAENLLREASIQSLVNQGFPRSVAEDLVDSVNQAAAENGAVSTGEVIKQFFIDLGASEDLAQEIADNAVAEALAELEDVRSRLLAALAHRSDFVNEFINALRDQGDAAGEQVFQNHFLTGDPALDIFVNALINSSDAVGLDSQLEAGKNAAETALNQELDALDAAQAQELEDLLARQAQELADFENGILN